MKELRAEIDECISALTAHRAEAHAALFHHLDLATEADNTLLVCDALAAYALSLGNELQFFGFDEFMRADGNKLLI